MPNKPPMVPLNLRIPEKLKLDFKLWCVAHGVEMTDVLVQAIEAVLSGKFKVQRPK